MVLFRPDGLPIPSFKKLYFRLCSENRKSGFFSAKKVVLLKTEDKAGVASDSTDLFCVFKWSFLTKFEKNYCFIIIYVIQCMCRS